ncbi:hypothetical protein HHI36_011701 [Cryptolaemus montrouzieri]|uniref:Intraflagellar transport protein 43 homolog n=1 Tax=Cryptolaemus montrouzieri TaxID=559131 RepID=A0ABD2MMK6_9CUCU
MSFDDNIDLASFVPKQGRRAKLSPENAGNSDSETPEAFMITRRKGGWADEGIKSAKTNQSSDIIEQKRFQLERHDSEDDIPVIPDIDDLSNDLIGLPDVNIPNVTVKKATYKEIDKDNKLENLKMGDANFGNIGDIDLTLLTSRLYPEAEVKSVDETWTLESLALDLANCEESS